MLKSLDFESARWLLTKVRDDLLECHLSIDKKEITEDNGDLLIAGWASTGDVDRMDDIIEPTAFKRTFDYFMANGVILAHHSPTWPVGVPEDAEVREKGLWLKSRIKGGFDPVTPEGRAFVGVKLGLIRAYSVGFRILAAENVESEKAGWKIERTKRRITDVDHYETSIVTIPANRKTLFKLSKAVAYGSDNVEEMYAEHRLKAAMRLFGEPPTTESHEEQESPERITRAVEQLLVRAATSELSFAGR